MFPKFITIDHTFLPKTKYKHKHKHKHTHTHTHTHIMQEASLPL